MRKSWTEEQLREAVRTSYSVRSVIKELKLIPAGGNYDQINFYLKKYKIDTGHFKGKGWNKGMIGIGKPLYTLEDILVKNSNFQSHKLKNRLFKECIKKPLCEECGWCKMSGDGRVPLELDHINGDAKDNRLINLRILCPNCHSLKPTHRGRNINKVKK